MSPSRVLLHSRWIVRDRELCFFIAPVLFSSGTEPRLTEQQISVDSCADFLLPILISRYLIFNLLSVSFSFAHPPSFVFSSFHFIIVFFSPFFSSITVENPDVEPFCGSLLLNATGTVQYEEGNYRSFAETFHIRFDTETELWFIQSDVFRLNT